MLTNRSDDYIPYIFQLTRLRRGLEQCNTQIRQRKDKTCIFARSHRGDICLHHFHTTGRILRLRTRSRKDSERGRCSRVETVERDGKRELRGGILAVVDCCFEDVGACGLVLSRDEVGRS
jgi:hypothetical protein